MSRYEPADFAALLLRLALAAVLLSHSLYLKLMVFTLSGTDQYFQTLGLPPWSGYAIFGLEVLTGALLLLGLFTRWFAALAAALFALTTWTLWGNGWMYQSSGGGWEYPAFALVASLVLAILGNGALALSELFESDDPLRRLGR